MTTAGEAIAKYRSDHVGTPEGLLSFYGPNPLNQPAYIKTGRIIDTGILAKAVVGGPYYWFDCRTAIIIMNCNDRSLGTKSFGWKRGRTLLWWVEISYGKARKHVYSANPGPNGFIDLRTVEQLEAGCCPKALETLELDSGPG